MLDTQVKDMLLRAGLRWKSSSKENGMNMDLMGYKWPNDTLLPPLAHITLNATIKFSTTASQLINANLTNQMLSVGCRMNLLHALMSLVE